jgi:hypothetical protein
VVSGMISGVLENTFFLRMTQITISDYLLLGITSLLIVVFFTLNDLKKTNTCVPVAAGGGIVGFLGFSCVACNKILIMLLGVGGIMTFIEPYQELIGILGVVFMLYAIITKYQEIGPSKL